ncbi:hypothetical protein SESBI_31386, partial [Sesbania bispinosa]
GIAKLPFIDEVRLLAEVRKIENLLTPEEARRNAIMFDLLFVNSCHPLSACISTLDNKCRNMSNNERAEVKERINPKESGGMNGYLSLCGGEPCPPIFRSPVASMEDIMDNHVICAIYRLPDPHKHITRPPQGVKLPKKTVTVGDLKPEPVLWHEDSGRRHDENWRKNPPGSISGRELGEAAHRLVVNSLQVKGDANGYRHAINGPPMSYAAAPMSHRQPLPYNYESRPGYVAMPPPISAPPLQSPPQFVPYPAVPTPPQYGYNQPYSPPMRYNPHHQSNSYGRDDHQHTRSHPYERNHHHASGYPSSGNNQNARYMNTEGSFSNRHHEFDHHSQNFQPSRASNQNWTPRNPSGHREYGQHSANQYSLLDRRGNRKPMPPPGYSRR